MDNFIDIKKLNLDELLGVVNLYPWFGGARKELCRRMSAMGVGGMDETQFADAALYVGDRSLIYKMITSVKRNNLTDNELESILKSYIAEDVAPIVDDKSESSELKSLTERKVHVIGGDFFTQEDYDRVKKNEDNVFSKYAAKARQEATRSSNSSDVFDIYTETLAGIYAEQGYYDHAKRIYSKLSLAYPEKNAYFATLIEKLEKINIR